MKAVLLFALVSLLSSCVSLHARVDPDYASVAEASLKILERSAPVVAFVVSPSIDPRAHSALAALRKTVSPHAVPQTEQFTLPEGYFVVNEFTVTGDTANFAGKLGPQWRATGPNDIMGCGANFTIPFVRNNGVLHTGSYSLLQC